MPTRNVDVMLSRPGIYVVVSELGMTFAEVEAGRCWQLTLTDYRRDGELRPGGWLLDNIRAIHGPFARVA
jgi:hypothetical protein